MKKFMFVFATVVAMSFSGVVSAQKTIVDVAVGNSDFSTLVAALKAADLVTPLQAEGPYTVFAPNNAAFGKIDQNALGNLLKPENKKALSNILTYHVIPSKLMASDVVAALKKGSGKVEVKALNGQTLTVVSKDGKIWLQDQKGNYSEIIATDVKADNGVIHVIDTVVMPN